MKSVEYITRKSMLYKTGVEYGDYTMNHVLGCSHGCMYPCYAYLQKRRFGVIENYEDWCRPRLVSNTIELLNEEIPRLRDRIKSVQLCFTTDPFMVGYPQIRKMTLRAIKRLNQDNIKCCVLTKGILPRALKDMYSENEYGITLISLDESFRKRMEPGAAPYKSRIAALRTLHNCGCKTWVSIEPYPTPNIVEQDLGEILDAVGFADRIIFGRTNYNKDVSSFDGVRKFYNDCASRVIDYCEENGISYHIKSGTISS